MSQLCPAPCTACTQKAGHSTSPAQGAKEDSKWERWPLGVPPYGGRGGLVKRAGERVGQGDGEGQG